MFTIANSALLPYKTEAGPLTTSMRSTVSNMSGVLSRTKPS